MILMHCSNFTQWLHKLLTLVMFFFTEKYAHLVGLEPGLRGKTFIVQVNTWISIQQYSDQ